jgi:hypothetical protein
MNLSKDEKGYCQKYANKNMDMCREYYRTLGPLEQRQKSKNATAVLEHEKDMKPIWRDILSKTDPNKYCKSSYFIHCPNYIPPVDIRGFEESLEDVPGDKIRRQSVKVFIFSISLFLLAYTLAGFWTSVRGMSTFEEYIEGMITFFLIWVILVALAYIFSQINRHWFGELVAVANEKAIYINTKKINWSEITDVTYHFKMPNPNIMAKTIQHSYLIIQCKDLQRYFIYHPSYYLIKKIKKYAPHINICSRSIRTEVLIWIAVIVISLVVADIIVRF